MLTLTDNASTIVKDIAEQIPDASGLRITSEAGGDQPSFEVAPAAAAEPGDQTVEQGGATVFLDESASLQLDDKVLDAAVDQAGGVQFALMVQA
jgi:Fe-S cluster assembly iron-binding protein IscA